MNKFMNIIGSVILLIVTGMALLRTIDIYQTKKKIYKY